MADKTPATAGQKPKADINTAAEAPPRCTETVEPNKLVFFYPTSDDRHEIYISRGKFHKALELLVQENWKELCKFPAYTGQGYEEWDD